MHIDVTVYVLHIPHSHQSLSDILYRILGDSRKVPQTLMSRGAHGIAMNSFTIFVQRVGIECCCTIGRLLLHLSPSDRTAVVCLLTMPPQRAPHRCIVCADAALLQNRGGLPQPRGELLRHADGRVRVPHCRSRLTPHLRGLHTGRLLWKCDISIGGVVKGVSL